MKLNWNFLGGGGGDGDGGAKQKTFCGGVWIFSLTAQIFILRISPNHHLEVKLLT